MKESRKYVLNQTLIILLGTLAGAALMVGIYAIIGRFSIPVLLGALVGAVLAVGNFFAMAMIATLAADRAEAQDVAGGQKLIKSSYPLRIAVLAVILILCARSGYFDVLAMVLPLLFVRPVLTLQEFFRKKGD